MAEKKGKRKQDTAYCKEANTEFHTGAHNAFTGGGNAAYQPRDSGIGKPGHGLCGKRQTEKSMQAQQETFGQKRAVDKPPNFVNVTRYHDKNLAKIAEIFQRKRSWFPMPWPLSSF